MFYILNTECKKFFIDYYKEYIEKIIREKKYNVKNLENKLEL
jgi:hypothetical protein